ncbi:MAG: hypothetical protein ACXVPX_05880 [Actinomycetota bacterium]
MLGLAVLAGGCTSSPRPRTRNETPPPPPGSIVAFTENSSSALVAFDVRRATVRGVDASVRSPLASIAGVSVDGLVGVAVTGHGAASVFRVTSAGAATAIGPALRGPRNAAYHSLAVAGGRAMVADCDTVAVLDLAAASRWRAVGDGCWAALSPDGRRVAFSPDGRRVFEREVAAGRARQMFDVSGLDLGTGRPARLFGPPSWGPGGIALTVVSGDQAAIYLARPSGTLEQLLQERLLKTVRPPALAWQPNGGLLGVMDDLGSGGVVRTFDPAAGSHRVVALDPLAFDGLVWSPDGSSLATLTSGGFLLVVGTDGSWRARVDTTWSSMLGWLA